MGVDLQWAYHVRIKPIYLQISNLRTIYECVALVLCPLVFTSGLVPRFRRSFYHSICLRWRHFLFSLPTHRGWSHSELHFSSLESPNCLRMLRIFVSSFHHHHSFCEWLAGTPIFSVLLMLDIFVFWVPAVASLSVRWNERRRGNGSWYQIVWWPLRR